MIDGGGHFQTSKKGVSNLKIIMHLNDKSLLYSLKHKYGGTIKEIGGSKALKYKLHNPKGLIKLVKDVNGLLRNPSRLFQLNKICLILNIKLLLPLPLTYNDGWFSGFLDSDGSIYIDEKSGHLIISVTQKNNYLLEPLQKLYGGVIKIVNTKESFQYSIYKKEDILNLVDNYFKNFPLYSRKSTRLNMIKSYYLLKSHRKLEVEKIDKFNQLVEFMDK